MPSLAMKNVVIDGGCLDIPAVAVEQGVGRRTPKLPGGGRHAPSMVAP